MTAHTPATRRAAKPAPEPAAPGVPTLFSAVRRHLWRRQFAAALRAAAWVSAGGMLLAATVHGAGHALSLGAVWAAVGLIGFALLARAAWQRPADGACALWADQHLGGASAFTTLLDTGRVAPGSAPAPAVRWLQAWATARVPASLRELAARREPARLARPLLSLVVCSALATFVLTLPRPSPTPPPPADRPAVAAAPAAARPLADGQEPTALAGEIAAALRAAPPRDTDSPGGGRRTDRKSVV